MPQMITLRELLDDPIYKAYFTKIPKIPSHIQGLPWKLMILKPQETQWRTKRFATYPEAFKALKKVLPVAADATINCPPLDWQPPIRLARVKGKVHETGRLKGQPIMRAVVWKPQISGDLAAHHWCPYCRRPTVFQYYSIHPAMTKQRIGAIGAAVDPTFLRCGICGASEMLVNLRHPERHQRWDTNRVRTS